MVARCRAAKVMSRGIARRIAFRLHDTPADPSLGHVVHDYLSDEKPRQLQRVAGKLFSGEPAKFERCAFHGYVELTSGGSLLKSRASSA